MKIRELHFAITEARLREALEILRPEDDSAEHGFIGVATASSGNLRRTIILHSIIHPDAGDVSWSAEGLVFSTAYKSRAADAASTMGAGLIFVHTHPLAITTPQPSAFDLRADARDLFFLGQALAPNAPLAAAIVGAKRHWSVREYVFNDDVLRERSFANATGMRVIGPGLRVLAIPNDIDDDQRVDMHAQDSSIRLWGLDGQKKLGALRIGLVGLGGVGSILAEHTARLGVGSLILIDFDFITRMNANRQQGATRDDIESEQLKVDVAERVARMAATVPCFEVASIEGSIVERTTIPHALDCDILLNAADSPWGRQLLDQLAFAHLIPVINGGTELRGNKITQQLVAGKCEVAVAGPEHPCFECAQVYTIEEASAAREHPEVRGRRAYLRVGDAPLDERSPSMIATNALVAGLMQLRLLAMYVGTTPATVVATQRYHPLEGTADRDLVTECRAACARSAITGLGDCHDLPTGVDRDYEVARATKTR